MHPFLLHSKFAELKKIEIEIQGTELCIQIKEFNMIIKYARLNVVLKITPKCITLEIQGLC